MTEFTLFLVRMLNVEMYTLILTFLSWRRDWYFFCIGLYRPFQILLFPVSLWYWTDLWREGEKVLLCGSSCLLHCLCVFICRAWRWVGRDCWWVLCCWSDFLFDWGRRRTFFFLFYWCMRYREVYLWICWCFFIWICYRLKSFWFWLFPEHWRFFYGSWFFLSYR